MDERIAVLYDIHGNLPALEAVLEDVRLSNVSEIIVGGDVLPGPMPTECLDLLLGLEIPIHFISGNGERFVLEALAGIENSLLPATVRETIHWNAGQLTAEHVARISKWPATLERNAGGALREILFCHATPHNDSDVFTAVTPESNLRPIFESVTARVVICGHTHMQFDRFVCGVRVVNAGSVGMPFGKPGAYWLLLANDIELRSTNYNLAQAVQRISQSAYPDSVNFAQRHVLDPPAEATMIETYERYRNRPGA